MADVVLGIPTQEAPDTPTEARVLIRNAYHSGSTTVRQRLDYAGSMGLSGEDAYVWLAYWALRELEYYRVAALNWQKAATEARASKTPDVGGAAWCDACHSYHRDNNPTCKKLTGPK